MQIVHGICVVGATLWRYVHQIRAVYLEDLTEQCYFGFVLRTELLYETDAVVAVDGLGHKGRQWSTLAIKVDDTFLYIGTLFFEFLKDFSLCSLGIEGQQLVYECFYPVKALFGSSKVEEFFYG